MSFRVTGIMLLVLVALGGVVWFSEFRDKGSAQATPADKARPDIMKFDDKLTQKIEVTKTDQKISMDRPDDQSDWTLQPSGLPGDRVRISSVLFRLASLQATRQVADAPTDLAQYGLDQPSITTTVSLSDGTTYTLQTGGKGPNDQATYVQRAGDPAVYLVPNQLATDLERLISDPPIQRPTPTPAPIPSPEPSPDASPTPSG